MMSDARKALDEIVAQAGTPCIWCCEPHDLLDETDNCPVTIAMRTLAAPEGADRSAERVESTPEEMAATDAMLLLFPEMTGGGLDERGMFVCDWRPLERAEIERLHTLLRVASGEVAPTQAGEPDDED